MSTYGAQGIYPNNRGQISTAFTLQPGASRLIPAGTWMVNAGLYSVIQEFDPTQNVWQTYSPPPASASTLQYINSDGFNYRVINPSGCVVGAVVTTAGSGYSSSTPPTVTFSAGGAVGTAIIGGAVSTSVTVTNAGTGYTYPPLVFFDAPPLGAGLQATGIATLSGTTVASITVTNQGAGYTNVPNVYIVADPRDTTGSGALATATLTGAGTVTGILVTNYGTPLTTMPTISFSSGSAAATPIMYRSIGAYTVTTAGSGLSGTVEVSAIGSGLSATSVLTNPRWTSNLVRTRKASILGVLSSGGLTTSGQTVLDGGVYAGSSVNAQIVSNVAGTGTFTAPILGFTWANNNDDIVIYPV